MTGTAIARSAIAASCVSGESNDNANQLQQIANRDHDHIYIKHDGSLDDGMEIVTHPMTLECHCNEMPWQTVMQEAISMGYLSHQCGTCGLHVHVNRSSLSYSASHDNQFSKFLPVAVG